MSAPQLGMVVFLASLSVLFAASLVAYLVTRSAAVDWRHGDVPGLPKGLLASTTLLFMVSVALHRATTRIAQNQLEKASGALWLAALFAAAFLIGQATNWSQLIRAELATDVKTLYVYTFVMLTGLHALHVLGGFVPLGVALLRTSRREYSSSRYEGLRLTVQYWDFLLVVWLVLLGTLWIAT